VTTTVSQVKDFLLTANGSVSGAPGQTVYLSHILTNLGNATDTYTLPALTLGAGTAALTNLAIYLDADGDGNPDNTTNLAGTSVAVTTTTPFRFVVAALIPATATSGQTNTINVSATDTRVKRCD
jgi:trimeric autotransporter adhesin